MSEDYKVFIHAYAATGEVAVADYYPGRGAMPTSAWRAGQVIEDRVSLPGSPGEGRRVFIGWYRETPRWRLPLSGAPAAWAGEPESLELRVR
jgi:hypothetical protein